MPKHNNKGRSNNTRYVKIDHYIMKSKAWQALTPRDIMIWLILCYKYNGVNNGRIGLSIRDAASRGKMSQNSAGKSINKLISLGFIKKRREGSFAQKQPLASEFELTHVSYKDNSASKEFTRWKPEKKTAIKEVQSGIKLGSMTNEDVV